MGRSQRPGSKSKAQGAPAVVEPTLPEPHPGSAAGAPGDLSLSRYETRQDARASIINELIREHPGEGRTKALAAAAKVLNDFERAAIRQDEDQLDARAAAELAKNNRLKARSRSGVVSEDEAPELPLAGSKTPN